MRRLYVTVVLSLALACAHAAPEDAAKQTAKPGTACIEGSIGEKPSAVMPSGTVRFTLIRAAGSRRVDNAQPTQIQVTAGRFKACLPPGYYAVIAYGDQGQGYLDVQLGAKNVDVFIYMNQAPLADERLEPCLANARGIERGNEPMDCQLAGFATKACSVRGRLTGKDGAAVPYGSIGLIIDRGQCYQAAQDYTGDVLSIGADRNGEFAFDGLSCGGLTVIAKADTGCVAEYLRFTGAGESRDVALQLP